jgi:uncharacterized protein YcfL
MKTICVFLSSILIAGCASKSALVMEHDTEQLTCVDVKATQIKLNSNYKLLFFARNFSSNVQVWMNPSTGKTLVTKTKDLSRKTCYVFDGFPTAMYKQ